MSDWSPKRTVETTDILLISYPADPDEGSPKADPRSSSSVLKNSINSHAVQPNHPVVGDSWDAPFFYEDARHAFYVTTTEQLVPVHQWDDFGLYVTQPSNAELTLAPLVFEPARIVPDPVGPISRQPGFGGIDPSSVERYVTEDAYIRKAIGTSGTVRYGDTEIGLAGSQVKSIRTR